VVDTMGKYIRRLRLAQNLTLRELARRLGFSAAYVSDVELGRRNPGQAKWDRWAAVLGVKQEEFEATAIRFLRRPCRDCPLKGDQ
jgi:transcriptional regulator with XRE-family HTH domain